ncbi:MULTISPECIES: ankyrin repeat domain-containing protein [unclassified Haematospirillum]|uniref:ankyrin repeat domain-containing protein n=1 Tax=unclassified Haematospirillum TaxID=2622088 RepID=UPI00143A6534|nr:MULTISPECIES: ankyrin repeat domain-containing protein [unclassified Haematospirillum]NKD55635.1 ankyrin repeat domain-containing protein [Haematospirillum sp. H4890]NKD75774.1 ankyrin repeat domain-containing protein [Haematospirillum sp. H4485]
MFRRPVMTGIHVALTAALMLCLLQMPVHAERSASEKAIQKWHERQEQDRWFRTTEPGSNTLRLGLPETENHIPSPGITNESMFERTIREKEERRLQELRKEYQEYVEQEREYREQLKKESRTDDTRPLSGYTPSWPPQGLPPDPGAWGPQGHEFPGSLRNESALPLQVADIDLPLEAPIISVMVSRNWPEMKRMFLGGTSPDTLSRNREPLIVLATRRDLDAAVDLLLKHKARINATDSFGNTALMWAADQGNLTLAKKLLDAGANPDLQNRQGMSALMRAARRGNAPVVELLLQRGVDTGMTDYTGRDALDMARESGNTRTLRALEGAS